MKSEINNLPDYFNITINHEKWSKRALEGINEVINDGINSKELPKILRTLSSFFLAVAYKEDRYTTPSFEVADVLAFNKSVANYSCQNQWFYAGDNFTGARDEISHGSRIVNKAVTYYIKAIKKDLVDGKNVAVGEHLNNLADQIHIGALVFDGKLKEAKKVVESLYDRLPYFTDKLFPVNSYRFIGVIEETLKEDNNKPKKKKSIHP